MDFGVRVSQALYLIYIVTVYLDPWVLTRERDLNSLSLSSSPFRRIHRQ